ncbi:hypothetical protein UWK_02236 [Desulfocapsa sulfexigens DSM 10523]|uniref:YcfA-like protein n=1 Tax=Desulfocapsa sulfexigens (strain DSM 10523 / SB164P1) TaxID=1167006 RepID=M1PAU7_DESSD|nr:hypothetical protein [Desulfocapsa sulfexigens]AGF78777.1 hypothetical protein UWK_02236 [Desulfocapsa sulfexigens DSM 10523]
MSRIEKLLGDAIANPKNVSFKNLLKLAGKAGFERRKSSGHGFMYKHSTIKAPNNLMNFQHDERDKSKAKPYQVKQLLSFIEEFQIKL